MTTARPLFLLATGFALSLCTLAGAQDVPDSKPAQLSERQGDEASVMTRHPGVMLEQRGLEQVVSVATRERAYLRAMRDWLTGNTDMGFTSSRIDERRVRGLRGQSGQTEIQRLRFRSAEEAQAYALNSSNTLEYPTLIEVRGRQVVQIRSPRLLDVEQAARIREGAWLGLPHPEGPPSVAATYLAADEFYVEGQPSNASFNRTLEGAVAAIRNRNPVPMSADATSGEVRNEDFAAGFDGSSVWYSGDPAKAERITAHAERFRADSRALRKPSQSDRGRRPGKPKPGTKPGPTDQDRPTTKPGSKPRPGTKPGAKPGAKPGTKPRPTDQDRPTTKPKPAQRAQAPKPVQEGAGSAFQRLVTKPMEKK